MHASIPAGSRAFCGHREFDLATHIDADGYLVATAVSTDDVDDWDPYTGGDTWTLAGCDGSSTTATVIAALKQYPVWSAATIG